MKGENDAKKKRVVKLSQTFRQRSELPGEETKMGCAVIAVDIPEERADTAAEVTVYFHDEGIEEHCRVSDLFSEGEKARAFLDKLIQKYALAERTLLFASVKEMDLFTLFEKSAGICVSASGQKISAASVLAFEQKLRKEEKTEALKAAVSVLMQADCHFSKAEAVWNFFKMAEGRKLLLRKNRTVFSLYALKENYLVPVSLKQMNPQWMDWDEKLPQPVTEQEELKKFTIDLDINEDSEHILADMRKLFYQEMAAAPCDASAFLKKNLQYLGSFDTKTRKLTDPCPAGSAETEKLPQDFIQKYRIDMDEVVSYVKKELFHNERILYHEISVDEKKKLFFVNDYTNDKVYFRLRKGSVSYAEEDAEDLAASAGRACYIMHFTAHLKREKQSGRVYADTIHVVILKEVFHQS